MEWNDDWRSELETKNPECYKRLCECKNTKNDILIISRLMYKYNQDRTKYDCLDRTIEWLTDWNSQFELYLSETEYQEILSKMC